MLKSKTADEYPSAVFLCFFHQAINRLRRKISFIFKARTAPSAVQVVGLSPGKPGSQRLG
jgi:hypothetical protein